MQTTNIHKLNRHKRKHTNNKILFDQVVQMETTNKKLPETQQEWKKEYTALAHDLFLEAKITQQHQINDIQLDIDTNLCFRMYKSITKQSTNTVLMEGVIFKSNPTHSRHRKHDCKSCDNYRISKRIYQKTMIYNIYSILIVLLGIKMVFKTHFFTISNSKLTKMVDIS